MVALRKNIGKFQTKKNTMQPTNRYAHTYINSTNVETQKDLVMQKTCETPTFFPCYRAGVDRGVRNGVECRVWSVKSVEC